ncbi:MAG TPA: pilus assembly protein TadG-related protein [Pirellulales bacterium]|nr:pilus assembly protein TadG-related protein [Pirellulales bacterium]
MRKNHRRRRRQGIVLVLFVLTLIALFSFLALAIDLGLVAMARTQCQAAADSAAMAGARALNGSSGNNYSSASPEAIESATNNSILGKQVTSAQTTINIGRYTYDTSTKQFEGEFPGPSTDNWTLVQAQVTANITGQLAFSKIFNFTPASITTYSTAVHRPRDIAVVMDFTGSMRFSSLTGAPYYGDRSSNNPDSNYPTWGAYSSASAGMQATTFTSPFDAANLTTTTTDGHPPVCADFYQDSSGTAAFTTASSTYATTPAGDAPLKTSKNTSSTYAQTLAQVLNIASPGNSTRDATYESSGYAAYSMTSGCSRYVQGPGYYGKTFFSWPPDPTNGSDGTTNDWRKRYFLYHGTNTAMDDNSKLWDGSGNWQQPGSSTYDINYTAILNWIKNIGPNPFPSTMRSGRIVYYTTIPSSINTSANPPTNLDERFWKDYIDYCLGLIDNNDGTWQTLVDGNTGLAGYGADYSWGTVKITAKSSLSGSPKPFMHYGDNPLRPKLHFWFGPLSMVDFLGNYNIWYNVNPSCSRYDWWPGTCHESPLYACKLGIQAALTDISNNHPNDMVSLIFFSTPRSDSSENDDTRFNRVRVGLGRSYSNMIESLWYPPSTVGNSSATVTPYDSNNIEVPRATGGTCYAYALMLAYNQFSANTTLTSYSTGQPAGDAGGNGRKGAQKIVIFETDGAPNTTATASFSNNGAYNSYYKVRYNYGSPSGSEFPSGINGYSNNDPSVVTPINSVCTQLAALDSASSPGYSTASKPLLIHCIGFGPYFDPSDPSAAANTATLNGMEVIGNVNDGMPSYKIINGNQTQMVSGLQQAFTKILQSGVQISLIQ